MKIDLVCLGIGKGATYVMKGKPSSAFAIRVDEKPTLLVDCGAGVVLSCLKNLNGAIPDAIYITHNHMDHTGDLPIAIDAIREQNGTKPRILGHSSVLSLVKKHRLHELTATGKSLKEIADWIEPDSSNVIVVEDDLIVRLFQSVHSYTCYGFMLEKSDRAILGYSADSAFDEDIYAKIAQAPVAIVDGRETGNHDHASFREIETFGKHIPNCSIRVIHYEQTQYVFSVPNVKLLQEGEVIQLV